MQFDTLTLDPKINRLNRRLESVVNTAIRGVDRVRGGLRIGGRKAPYDDDAYEFIGGDAPNLRKKHYDKSLRHLWKAESNLPWSSFRDCNADEKELLGMADRALSDEERECVERMRSEDYKTLLDREYTPEQKQAIVNILTLIGHGEAYAWLVSTDLLNKVKSTGGRAALTMQVLEEAKHFVVLRELIGAFDRPIPRMNAWEYVLLERTFKSNGLEQFFGMNIVVEGFALGLFGMMAHMPGLEVLALFHLDESRHTALPTNYFKEFPMTWWRSHDPRAQLRRLSLVLPALPMLPFIEADLAILGVDAFDFGGSTARKILNLADRVGFRYAVPRAQLEQFIDWLFNSYCQATRPEHERRTYMRAETSRGRTIRAVESTIFGKPHAA